MTKDVLELQAVILDKCLKKSIAGIQNKDTEAVLEISLASDFRQSKRLLDKIDTFYNIAQQAISLGHFQRALRFIAALNEITPYLQTHILQDKQQLWKMLNKGSRR
jgi:hypothetical protein